MVFFHCSSGNLSICFRMVRRGVLFAVCSVFLSMPSQNLLMELSDQLFETRAWLAGNNTEEVEYDEVTLVPTWKDIYLN